MSHVTSTTRIAFARFIGTAISLYDFYIYDHAGALANSGTIDANLRDMSECDIRK